MSKICYIDAGGNSAIRDMTPQEEAAEASRLAANQAIVPQTASPLQIRRVLRAHPQAAAIRTYFQGLAADQKEDWQFATRIRRDSPLIAGMQTALGATDAQIDNLFRAALAERDD